jgi:DNA-directed RNA polymerase subunit K/omega
MEKKTIKYTKYEVARIIGARALQISMNAPLLMVISKEKLEELNYDPIKLAELEFKSNALPISVKRPFPKKELVEEEAEEIEIVKEEPIVPGEKKVENVKKEKIKGAVEEEAEEKEETEEQHLEEFE